MKKVLLILFVLAICVLAFPHGVMADNVQDKPVTIEADYGSEFVTVFDAYLDPEFPAWTLGEGANGRTDAIFFELNTLDDWIVTGDASATSGKMVGSEHPLKNLFLVDSPLYGPMGFASELKFNEGKSSTSDQDWKSDVSQVVAPDDYASSTPYAITITFTCSTTF